MEHYTVALYHFLAREWLQFWHLQYKDQILTIATFSGPVVSTFIAVFYTKHSDDNKLKTGRQLQVFRNLIKTRSDQLHQDHVMSLNLVVADFAGDVAVLSSLKNYINHLYLPVPSDQKQSQFFLKQRITLFNQLLLSISKVLKIPVDDDSLSNFNYMPSAWVAKDLENTQQRMLLNSVLSGITPIAIKTAITAGPPQQNSLYPPPPKP